MKNFLSEILIFYVMIFYANYFSTDYYVGNYTCNIKFNVMLNRDGKNLKMTPDIKKIFVALGLFFLL